MPPSPRGGPGGAGSAALLGLLLLCGAPAAQEGGEGERPPDAADGQATLEAPPLPVRGYLRTRYLFRKTAGESDHDLYGVLALDVGDAARQKVTGHVMVRGALDLDGDPSGPGPFVFGSLEDTRSSRATGRIYHAYVDVHRMEFLEVVRVGRQVVFETPEVAWLDGVRLETGEAGALRAKLGAYGGVPVHLFESSPSGDAIAGTFLQARPLDGTRVRADWMHVRDRTLFATKERNDLVGLRVWQAAGERLRLEGAHTVLDGRPREWSARAFYVDPDHDLAVQASFSELLKTQRRLALELDPFFDTLFDHEPYWQARLMASKGFGERLSAQAGVDVRRLKRPGDAGPFNREFDRYYATASLHEVPAEGSTLSLTGEVWDATRSGFATWGAEFGQDLGKRSRATAGSYYSLYKFSILDNRERERVRTYFGALEHRPRAGLRLGLHYEYEVDPFDRYHLLRIEATWRF